MKQLESQIQQECVKWFRLRYPHLAPNLFAVPNGGFRHISTARMMKREGQLSGVSDLILLVPSHSFHGMLIEMKRPGGRLSATQKEWLDHMDAFHYARAVCHSFDEFEEAVVKYLNLNR